MARTKYRAFFKGFTDKIAPIVAQDFVKAIGGKDFFVFKNDDQRGSVLEVSFDKRDRRDSACIKSHSWKSYNVIGVPSDIGWHHRDVWIAPIKALKSKHPKVSNGPKPAIPVRSV